MIRSARPLLFLACLVGLCLFLPMAMLGCSAGGIQRNLDGANAAVAEADESIAAIEGTRQAILAELALLPPGDPAREPLIDGLEKLQPVADKWAALRDDYQARADQLAADLVAAGEDDAAATAYAGATLLELGAAAGVPFVGIGALLLRQWAKTRQITTDTAYGIASARAASSEFNALIEGPVVGGILRANIPDEVAKIGRVANAKARPLKPNPYSGPALEARSDERESPDSTTA